MGDVSHIRIISSDLIGSDLHLRVCLGRIVPPLLTFDGVRERHGHGSKRHVRHHVAEGVAGGHGGEQQPQLLVDGLQPGPQTERWRERAESVSFLLNSHGPHVP